MGYELDLPAERNIDNIFHVSCLKNPVRENVKSSLYLPPLDKEEHLQLFHEELLEVQEKKLQIRTIREYLVRWKDVPIKDATWEGEHILQHPTLKLLGGKKWNT